MKVLIIVLCLVISSSSALCQYLMPFTYQFEVPNKFLPNYNLSCLITMYKDGRYAMDFENCPSCDDLPDTEMILSNGTYSLKGDRITLNDAIHGFVMRLRRLGAKKDSVIVEQGFPFLKNQKGFLRGYIPVSASFLTSQWQKKERESYLQSHTKLYPLWHTLYESEDNYIYRPPSYGFVAYEHSDYELSIQEENKYVLYYMGIVFSQGTWSRDGNELALYDESLQHAFYVLIGKDKLISKYLPGDYYGIELKPYRMLRDPH